jgi:hypothetical protein
MDKTIRRISMADWQNSWMGVNPRIIPHLGNFLACPSPSGKVHEGWQWFRGRNIYVFREATVSRETTRPVISGIRSLTERLGLDIEVRDLDEHESVRPAITYATQPDGTIDGDRFGSFLVEEPYRDTSHRGTLHADVLITDKYLAADQANWGQSAFDKGYLIVSLPGARQRSHDFIVNIAMHETGHLLGFPLHHDSLDEEVAVEGYPKVSDCLMLWKASTKNICPRCEDAIRYFWRGLERGLLPGAILR